MQAMQNNFMKENAKLFEDVESSESGATPNVAAYVLIIFTRWSFRRPRFRPGQRRDGSQRLVRIGFDRVRDPEEAVKGATKRGPGGSQPYLHPLPRGYDGVHRQPASGARRLCAEIHCPPAKQVSPVRVSHPTPLTIISRDRDLFQKWRITTERRRQLSVFAVLRGSSSACVYLRSRDARQLLAKVLRKRRS